MDKQVLLIDGNSIMNRAFFGIRELTNAEGLHTNAIYGFLNIMLKMIEEEQATHVVVAFDLKAPTFRHLQYEGYKGNRKGMPEELREQMPVLKTLLEQMHIRICQKEGYEADDILGTLALHAQEKGMPVTILSGDRDMLQIATERIKISIPKTKGGQTTTEHYYAQDVEALYHVGPRAFIDIKGLMGDASDSIPGVAGIGEKTAIKLIETYGSMENLYEHLDELTPRQNKLLSEDRDMAFLSKSLATIKTDCETDLTIDDCELNDIYNQEAYGTFKRLEFKSFYPRFESSQSTTQTVAVNQEARFVELSSIATLNKLLENVKTLTYVYVGQDIDYYFCFTADRDQNAYYYADQTLITHEDMRAALQAVLQDQDCVKVTHDLKEQLHALEIDLSTDNHSIYDLSLVGYLLNPSRDTYNIDDLATEYLNRPLKSSEELLGKGKSKQRFSGVDQQMRTDYFAAAVQTLLHAYPPMKEKMVQYGLMDLYMDIELPLLYVLKNMEALGVAIDGESLQAYGERLKKTIDELEARIHEYAGEVFNINSPKQMGTILFEKLNLPAKKKTATGYSTAADVLEKLKFAHPIVMDILSYRQLAKLKSTYADGLFEYIEGDGRIHTNFNQKVTTTGRISSMDPNLQNIPIRMEIGREIRKVFIPKPGCVFVDADYSQIELRLLAHLSGDESFVEAFRNNLDIHTMTASQVFHTPFEEVTSLQRRNAKAVNFGIVYGISAFGLSEDLGISRKEAADYIEQYFARYPKVKTFLDETVETAKLQGVVKTMYGRLRQIPELSSGNFMTRQFGERIAMNTPIQGSAADIIKIAMIKVYERLEKEGLKSQLILTVHDELVIETQKDEVDRVIKLLVEEMENCVSLSVPLTVEAHVGENWYAAK